MAGVSRVFAEATVNNTEREAPREESRSRDEIRAAILEVAAEVFVRYGVDMAPLTAFANAAHCDLATVTQLFSDASEIHDALLELVRREGAEMFLITMPGDLDLREKLALLLSHHAEWGDERQSELMLFHDDGPLKADYLSNVERWLDRHDAQQALDLHVDNETAAYILRGLQQAFFARWLARGGVGRFADNVPAILHVFLSGVTGE